MTRPPGFVCVVGEVLEVGDESRTLVVVRGLVGEVLQIDDESKIMIVSFTALSAAVFCRFCSPLVCLSAAPSLSYSPQFLGGVVGQTSVEDALACPNPCSDKPGQRDNGLIIRCRCNDPGRLLPFGQAWTTTLLSSSLCCCCMALVRTAFRTTKPAFCKRHDRMTRLRPRSVNRHGLRALSCSMSPPFDASALST